VGVEGATAHAADCGAVSAPATPQAAEAAAGEAPRAAAAAVVVRSPAADKLMRMAEAEHKRRAASFGLSGRLRRSRALMKNSKNLRFRELYHADDAGLNAFVVMVIFFLIWLAHTRSWPFDGLER